MKLKINTNVENSVYQTEFLITDITPQNVENIKDIGEADLLINVAGNITKETTTQTPVVDNNGDPVLDADGNPTFTTTTTETILFPQGDRFVRFPSEFNGYKRDFNDRMLNSQAEEIAKQYVVMMEERVRELVTRIEAYHDDFTDEREILL